MLRKHFFIYTGVLTLCMWIASGSFTASLQTANTLSEGFEAGGKVSYTAANLNLASGSWYFNDALTGDLSSDRKTGAYSARVRNTGAIRMNFNVSNAGTFTVKHAIYGSDGASNWELWKSINNGASWSKVGSSVATNSTILTTASFAVNSSSACRFEIRKTGGGSYRINFDSVTVTSYSGSTPTPTATPPSTPTPPTSSSVHLTMGNPSNAAANVNQPTNYLLEKPQYVSSYNRDNGRPNWVSWHLDASWLGSTPRQNNFRPDTSLPAGWYQVTETDYSGSGYDRGHMCPSGDRTNTTTNNAATFLMTNMVPQAADNNQKSWADLENYCRNLAAQGNELYIISGGYGTSGYIAAGRVAVPTYTWKVIMVLPNGTNDVARVNTSTRLIAVVIPNQNGINIDWRAFRYSVDYVESLTGYNFFSNVPTSIQNSIESGVDSQLIDDSQMSPDKYTLEEIENEAIWNSR